MFQILLGIFYIGLSTNSQEIYPLVDLLKCTKQNSSDNTYMCSAIAPLNGDSTVRVDPIKTNKCSSVISAKVTSKNVYVDVLL